MSIKPIEHRSIDDLQAAIAASQWLQAQLGRVVPGMLAKAGGFPSDPPRAA
jgi:hypothetical protein